MDVQTSKFHCRLYWDSNESVVEWVAKIKFVWRQFLSLSFMHIMRTHHWQIVANMTPYQYQYPIDHYEILLIIDFLICWAIYWRDNKTVSFSQTLPIYSSPVHFFLIKLIICSDLWLSHFGRLSPLLKVKELVTAVCRCWWSEVLITTMLSR